MAAIGGSVGRGGKNARADVVTVQKLINQNLHRIAPVARLETDGVTGRLTLRAIEAFQRRVVGMRNPDGRVDPGGTTLRRLSGETAGSSRRRLPSFERLWTSYPTVRSPCDQGYENQCALRVSIALIGAGFALSDYDEPRCRHGHARGAESLAQHLWQVVGRPDVGSGRQARTRVLNRRGIVFFRNIEGFRQGQGDHIDLWDGAATKTGEYFSVSQEVWFWPVP